MMLPIVPQDKANHFIYGFAIFMILNQFLNDYVSLAIVILIAFGKEIYDKWDYGGFDILDAICTLTPSIILTIKNH